LTCVNAAKASGWSHLLLLVGNLGAKAMAARAKRTKRAKTKTMKKAARKATVKQAKKSAGKKTAKKAAKKARRTAKKIAKKVVAKKSSARKTAKMSKGAVPAGKAANAPSGRQASEAPAARTAWRISPEISRSVLKIDLWKKGDLKIEYRKVYRTGWIVVDQKPDLAEYNPEEGIDIFEEFEFDEHELYDGSEEASIVANELPAEERQRLLALSEAELADEGWTLESVTRFRGPLVVEQVG
jgi:hypothetical protein